jgi:hypothetical protein
MTQTHSKLRQQAEIAFGQTQNQFFAKDRAAEELDYVAQARAAKTLRLREARLSYEAERLATITLAIAAKRS